MAGEGEATGEERNFPVPALVVAALVIIGAATLLILAGQPSDGGLAVLTGGTQEADAGTQEASGDSDDTQTRSEPSEITPSSFAVRQRYFEETFRPRREQYDLFEKASGHLGIPIEAVPDYFSLHSEADVFAELPSVPEDFSEIAFLLASGRTYSIGLLSEEYFMQPEFYPGFKESGLKYWSEPDPKYWATNGYGSYPAEQFDTISHSGRKEFTGVVFFHSGYGVQTYQGVTIIPDAESLKHFDIEITPDTFLLTPTFPKFTKDWAHQVIIRGKLKPGTPPGEYNIGFLVTTPPIEKKREWEFKYRNIYFDAVTSIAPSRFPFNFMINVTE